MSSARRRVLLYWLLLILPALAVGAGTAWLLRREQTRIAEQREEAMTSRRTAVLERSGLIVESVEALLADVQNSLATSLRDSPRGREQRYLEELRESNFLVEDVFGATAAGEVRWGANEVATREWVTDRIWTQAPRAVVIEEARSNIQYAVPEGDFAVVENRNFRDQANLRSQLQVEASKRSSVPSRMRLDSGGAAKEEQRMEAAEAERLVTWTTAGEGETVSLIAWMSNGEGLTVGVALDSKGLIEQLRGTIPRDIATDERYFLTAVPVQLPMGKSRGETGSALVRIPLSSALLPGWSVEGFWLGYAMGNSADSVVFLTGGMLVLILVTAIISGGNLLLREARRSEWEAAQRVSFVSHVSHEFKTPLTTIRMYAELLAQNRVKGEAKREEYFAVIGQETGRLTRLVNNALEFGRLEQGERQLDVIAMDVAKELRTIGETQRMRLESRGIALRQESLESETDARVDRDGLHHIVLNLVDNVCKYAASGRELKLEIRRGANGVIQVVVGDRGPGVAEADRERIFAKFSRLDEALTSEQKGAGLGLSISRELARRMGGELDYSSRVGGGSEFILTLP